MDHALNHALNHAPAALAFETVLPRDLLEWLVGFMMGGSIGLPAEHQTMAHKKGQGSTQNGRDSNAQYRGIKLSGGQLAKAGSVLVTQCGTKWKAGYLVHQGRDYTLTALVVGTVRFRGRSVDIIPADPSTPRMAIDR